MFEEHQYYIIIGSVAAWILPPFKQFREKYFYYFLILAFTDAFVISLYFGVSIILPNGLFYTLSSFLLYVVLFNKEELLNKKLILLILFTLSTFVLFLPGTKEKYLMLCIIHMAIMYEFLKRFLVDLSMNESFNLFLFLLVFYEMSVIIKFIVSLLDFRWGTLHFELISILEILLAVTFALFKERQLIFQKLSNNPN